jgi:hypothetical protein
VRLAVPILVSFAACGFEPSLDGRYRCDVDGSCPVGLHCAADRLCRAEVIADLASGLLRGAIRKDAGRDDPVFGTDDPLQGTPDLAHSPPPPDLAHSSPPPDLAVASPPPDLGTPVDLSTCVPATCGPHECGVALDHCGGKIACGPCPAHDTCGAGGANLCGHGTCTPVSCAAVNVQCGLISDRCARVLDCGACSPGKRCDSQNHCG